MAGRAEQTEAPLQSNTDSIDEEVMSQQGQSGSQLGEANEDDEGHSLSGQEEPANTQGPDRDSAATEQPVNQGIDSEPLIGGNTGTRTAVSLNRQEISASFAKFDSHQQRRLARQKQSQSADLFSNIDGAVSTDGLLSDRDRRARHRNMLREQAYIQAEQLAIEQLKARSHQGSRTSSRHSPGRVDLSGHSDSLGFQRDQRGLLHNNPDHSDPEQASQLLTQAIDKAGEMMGKLGYISSRWGLTESQHDQILNIVSSPRKTHQRPVVDPQQSAAGQAPVQMPVRQHPQSTEVRPPDSNYIPAAPTNTDNAHSGANSMGDLLYSIRDNQTATTNMLAQLGAIAASKHRVQYESFTATFKGESKESVSAFIKKIEREMIISETLQSDMCKVLQKQLKGSANDWFSTLPEEIAKSWPRVRQALLDKYDTDLSKSAITSQCYSLTKQDDETVHQYSRRVQKKLIEAEFNEEQQLDLFIKGLPKYMRYYVRRGRPESMDRAIYFASLYESNPEYGTTKSQSSKSGRLSKTETMTETGLQAESPTLIDPDASLEDSGTKPKSILTKAKETVGFNQVEATSTCFNCGEPGHWAYQCQAPKEFKGHRSPSPGDRPSRQYQNNDRGRSPSPYYRRDNSKGRRYTPDRRSRDRYDNRRDDNNRRSPSPHKGKSDGRYCSRCDMTNHALEDCVWVARKLPCPICSKCNRKGHTAEDCKNQSN